MGFAFRIRKYAYTVVHVPSKARKYIADYTADALRRDELGDGGSSPRRTIMIEDGDADIIIR